MVPCVPGVETSIGKIYPIETELSYHHAVEFCEKKDQALASLHDIEVLKIVSNYINRCFDKEQKNGWGVGLYFNEYENIEGFHIVCILQIYFLIYIYGYVLS